MIDPAPVVFDLMSCVAHDVFQLRSAAYQGGEANLMAVARSLASGVMSWVVKTAHEAFEAGTALDDLVLNMLRHTFEARLAFIEGLAVLAEANAREIRDTLEFVDANLRAFSSAILVLDQESYDNATYYYDSWERKVAYDYTESLTGPEWWQTWKRG